MKLWMRNYIPLFYVDVINYTYFNAGLANLY